MEMSDSQLAALAGRGDAGAFQTLFERYQHPVYNFVYRMVDNAEDAADIVQNAFIKMYGVLGEKTIDNFSAYLYRTARNLAYDEMRRRQRFADVDQDLLAPEDPNIYADPQRALMLGEQIDSVRRALGNLGENQRAALILRELQDLDYDQMSEVLESNRNAVGALLSRARLRLREELRMAQIKTEEIAPECEEIISLLSPYIDGELPESAVSRVETHVADCTFCAAALEEMREASRSFRAFIPVVPPPDIAEAVTGRVGEMAEGSGFQSEAEGQGGSEVQSGSEGQGEPTRVSSSATEPALDETMIYGGRGGGAGEPSTISRILKSKATWIVLLSAVLLLTGATLLLADRSASDEPSLSGTRESQSASDGSTTLPAGSITAPGAVSPDPAASESANSATVDESGASGGITDSTGFGIEGGSVDPGKVYEGEEFSYTVSVTGEAASVSVEVVSANGVTMGSFGLKKTSGDSSGQKWSGSTTAGGAGVYQLYAVATGIDGSQSEVFIGSLTVGQASYDGSNGNQTPPANVTPSPSID